LVFQTQVAILRPLVCAFSPARFCENLFQKVPFFEWFFAFAPFLIRCQNIPAAGFLANLADLLRRKNFFQVGFFAFGA